ncbi:HAD-IA family hydrolase [Leucobacter sp. gxy201]|uniref:HAD family hydrolase n=1 Tax=Leucobacter sp. gxy201 TaxID=2957200 RepID=UPI003DA0469F
MAEETAVDECAATYRDEGRIDSPRGRFAGVLFDCDGVLVDSELITNGTLREMLHELGWPISSEDCLRRFIGRALKDEWRVIEQHTGFRITEDWLAGFRALRDERLRAHLEAIPGAPEAVAAVSRHFGGRIACATGADRPKVEMQLAKAGIAGYFGDRVFSGMEMPRSKPAPDVYLAAARALGIDPVDALVVEDTVAGVTAGVAAGATVLGFSYGGPVSTDADVLLAAGASRVFRRMSELPALVAELDGAPIVS